ncbi:Spermine/spermidine acetyltransferase [Acaryochloris thomasi RCC1774]|uniref:Spermine/spermidine acetyltransferase n=1 Tax=Acaryochloris thomasi RCC1774 TaxID=1764569 RepID=A0A2W1JLR6_9CYAN|nr:GNAT family N-acetyltransferase [Acaryochloris thomasi]PZD71822.1 Spermine/spermidine acetyltransferase [Acaryochloris thomasi RCC1774]
MTLKIRPALANDIPLIDAYIRKKSEFDRAVGAYQGVLGVTPDKLQQTLFGAVPFAYVLFSELNDSPVGFALYGFRYSSFAGQPSIWLDDLYIDEMQRSQGAGAALMHHLAQIAQEYNCTHLAWTADARNIRGLQFYDRISATVTEQRGTRCFLSWAPKVGDRAKSHN